MNRRLLVAGLATLLLASGAAQAQSLADRLVARLGGEGYAVVEVSQTFLGRTRIVAEKANQRREIVFNPRTGAILRDVLLIVGTSDRDSSGGLDDDNEDEDDEDDDDHGGGDHGDDHGGSGRH